MSVMIIIVKNLRGNFVTRDSMKTEWSKRAGFDAYRCHITETGLFRVMFARLIGKQFKVVYSENIYIVKLLFKISFYIIYILQSY